MTIGGDEVRVGDSVECWIDGEIERGTVVYVEDDVITVRVMQLIRGDELREVHRKHVVI